MIEFLSKNVINKTKINELLNYFKENQDEILYLYEIVNLSMEIIN